MPDTPRIKEVRRVPFSSIVGQSISLHDESGAHICQLPIVGLVTSRESYRAEVEAMAEQIVALLRVGVEARDRLKVEIIVPSAPAPTGGADQ